MTQPYRRSRRGSFGLQPRVAPNVTNQIVALAREYVAKRDQNIMDAWRNGGTFEGKKVTDSMVLAYWNERAQGLDPNDPNYEYAKNQVEQLQYGIEQSKMDVLHVQGKLSDTAYAQFFLKWAKKVPANSEFYRVLQKDAAQLIESAKAKGRAGAEAAKTKAFNEFVTNTTNSKIAIGDAMTAALTDLSKATGLSITGNGDELLTLLTNNVKANPDQYRRLLDTIHKADPTWDGNLTESYFSQHLREATAGYSAIADRAQKDGYVSAYVSATQGMSSMASWGQNLKVWPVAESYSIAENSWLKVMQDPNASQMDKIAASSAFSNALNGLASTPGIDAGSKTMIQADAQRLLGQDAGDSPSFGSTMLGRPGVDPQSAMQIGALIKTKAEMDANPTAWAYAPVDANGQFDPTGRGPIGMVPAGQVQPGAQAIMVPGGDGKAVMALVMPHSVYVQDPNNPNGNPKLAGYQISYNVGGRTIQMWGYKDAQGGNHWSLISPVAEGATTSVDNKGDVYVTPQSSQITDPIARAQQLDTQLGTHIADQLKSQQQAGGQLGATTTVNQLDSNGRVIGTVELKYQNGTFVATQTQNTLDKDGHVVASQSTPLDIAVNSPQAAAFSQSRLAAGNLPGTTFDSPLQASVHASTYTATQDMVNKFASDPAFQQAFVSQTMQTLGITNPYDPRVASAWKDATSGYPTADSIREARDAKLRNDLNYPGIKTPYQRVPAEITFGTGPQLVLPGLPGSGGDKFPQKDQMYTPSTGGLNGIQPQVLPGLGAPGQLPAGSPAPTITPTPTPTPTAIKPSVTPGSVPSPTVAPAPTPAPTPYSGKQKAL
jgi:hypothetical protein